MQKLLNKVIAVIITLMMASGSIMPAIAYATSTNQDSKTSEENVEFNATINGGYSAKLNLDEGGTLNLDVKVSGTGYLKNAKVTLHDNNYQIDSTITEGITSINGNDIELEEVNTGKMLNISLPIKLAKEEIISSDILDKDSTVTLNAIYVNESGKERKIEKTLIEHVEWTGDLKEVVSQNLVRYIKVDDNKTMVSFKINEGLENNKMPVQSKEITIKAPTLENSKPSNVIVTGQGISYTYENDVVTIKKENVPNNEGKVIWNSQDEYIVTYIYDTVVDETTVESQVVAKSQVKGQSIEAQLENYTYELKEKVGEYVEAEALGTTEINKGYMYANLKNKENNLETTFETTLKTHVGLKDVVDSIKIQEQNSMFNNLNAGNSIINKKVKVNRDSLINILGENGTVKVLTQDGREIGTLSKEATELEVSQTTIAIQTSKVENEGELEFTLEKAVTSNLTYNKEQVKTLAELTTTAVVEGYKENKLVSSKQVSKVIYLKEPTSNAKLDVNVQNLSTVVLNEDVIISATLKTSDISDALYTNAKLNVILPEEVKQINIKEAGLIYEDELVLSNLVTNQNVISLQLDGTQTTYKSQATSEGAVVRIVADVVLDNLAPTTSDVIALDYLNAETGEVNEVTASIGIVAPTGFVTTNTLEVNGESVTAQESSDKVAKIDATSDEKEATLSGIIVNNLGYEATGLTVVGKIPTSGNKDANGVDLGSNFDTQLTSPVSVSGIEADILYSENVNESIDGSSWSTTYTPLAKAYKIVARNAVGQVSSMSFNYKVKVPANLQYGSIAKSTYAVYYDNNAELGLNKNYVLAKAVGITTGEIPKVALEPAMIETNTEAELQNGSAVKEGKLITYRLNVKNTGTEVINNLQVKINLPSGLAVVEDVYEMSDIPSRRFDRSTKTLTTTIESLNAGETKPVEVKLGVVQKVAEKDNVLLEQKITAELIADKIRTTVKSSYSVTVVRGDLIAYAFSDKENKNLKPQDKLQYNFVISNPTNETKNNVNAKITIPKEFDVESISKSDGIECNYDKSSSTITYSNASLKPGSLSSVLVNLVVGDFDQDKQVKITGNVSCAGMTGTETLNEISCNLTKQIVSADLTSNIQEGNFGDTDNLEYYIHVTNNSNDKIDVEIKDVIPSELRVAGYEIQDAKGTSQKETSSRTVFVGLSLNANDSARLTIRTEPYTLQKGKSVDIENSATITYNKTTVTTNTLKHKIVGTSEHSAGLSDQNSDNNSGNVDNYVDSGVVTEEGTYAIRGTAWLDGNSNGIKESSEEKISGLTVKLYYVNPEKRVVESNGKELVTTTGENGEYLFTGVLPGSYVVVADVDSQNYGVTQYKASGVSEAENSDFVISTMDEKEVAATDQLNIMNANIYNIDLGLEKNKIFDLDIENTITRITVTNTKSDTKTYDQDSLSSAKIELASANVEFATVLIEYSIAIQNKGQVAGYAKSIVDYIPEGMTFNSELNSSWYLGPDGNAYNSSLANTLINPGETKVVTIVLSRKMTGENTGTVRNTSEVLMSYNEYGLADIDAKSGYIQQLTDDKSSSDVIIGMATAKEIASFTGIALGILAILGVAMYEIKKHVINKMYNF